MASLPAPTPDRRIRLEMKPASATIRAFSAIICTPLLGVGIVAAVKVVIALATGESYLPHQWVIGIGIATFFTVIPSVGIYVVLKGASVLLFDPDAGSVVLTRRFAFRTWTRRFALAAMPKPEVQFNKGDSEDPPSFSAIINLPNGGMFHYYGSDPHYGSDPLSLRKQEAAMEDLCLRIRTLISNAGWSAPGPS